MYQIISHTVFSLTYIQKDTITKAMPRHQLCYLYEGK